MHFFCGMLGLSFSILYLFFSLPAVYPTVAVIEVPLSLMKISGWAYLVLAVVHWLALFRIVRRSIRFRGLTFSTPFKRLTASRKSLSRLSRAFATLDSIQQSCWKPWNQLFGVEGSLGVNGKYFYVAFLAREALEVGLQSYQSYQLSGSVRRPWITNLAVATIVLNSLSTPLVYAILHRQQESARRFMSILVDMCLDFCCATVIPICVAYPYISTYNISAGSMPASTINDDVRFTSALIEIRQFCITSTLDFLATMLPQLSVFTCLNLAQKIVRRDRSVASTSVGGKLVKRKRISMSIVVSPEELTTADLPHSSSQFPHRMTHSITLQRMHSTFHVLIILWSAIVLSVHVRANFHAQESVVEGCRLSLNAWLAVGTPCSVMQINCYRLGLVGAANEIAQILQPLDRTVLRNLIVTHCSSLEIPLLLTEFSEMTDFEVYNSTLMAWPAAAAATPSTMRSLVNFSWFASPFISFPAGLLHSTLPKGFSRFFIARSNATELPRDLGTLWSGTTLDTFSLQFTQIDHLPPSFADLRAHKIRLISNRLHTIDESAFATKRLTTLHLSGNPLQTLPASIGDTTGLLEFLAEHTNVRNVPAQIGQWYDRRLSGLFSYHSFSMYGSPICEDNSDAPSCLRDHGNINGTFRWDLIEPQRTLDK